MSGPGANSNAGEMDELYRKLLDTFDLTRPGEDGSFGEDLLDDFALGVRARTVDEQLDAGGNALEPNRGDYGEEKREAGIPVGVGLDADSSDRMLSLVQLKGERSVGPDRAEAVYGVSPEARDKANWFSSGSTGPDGPDGERSGAEGQPPRPFWGFDDDMVGQMEGRMKDRLDRAIADLGGS